MRLNILQNVGERVFDGVNLTIPTSYLKQNVTHLFIASNTWDVLFIELTDDIQLNVLKYVASRSKDVIVELPETVTEHTINLLCELYPTKAGAIRKAYMLGRDLRSVI